MNPIAYMRRWKFDKVPEKNENGRWAWPEKMKYHPITSKALFDDDVALYAHELSMPNDPPVPVIVCAANRWEGVIVCGARHFDDIMRMQIGALHQNNKPDYSGDWEQGFIDQWGNFHTREEALVIATEAGQINFRRPKTHPVTKLFSEDLY